MTRPDDKDGDDLRDAHLLAALRHAPDRESAPPAAVSALILARARAAAAPRSRWSMVLDALRRPHVAGAFATLAVATLVGVMWSVQEPPAPEVSRPLPDLARKADKAEKADKANEADRANKAPAAKADAPAAQSVPAAQGSQGAQSVPEGAALPAPFVDAASSVVSSVPPAPQRSRDDAAKKSAAPAPVAPATPRLRTKPSLDEPKEADVSRPSPSPFELGGAAPAPAPAPPVVTALPAPVAPPTPTPQDGARERRTLSDEKASASGRVASSMPMPSPQDNWAARQESAAATAALAKQMRVVDDPLARIDALLSDSTADAVWTPARGKASPHAQAQRELWSRVRDATRGRWLRADGPPPTAEAWLVLAQRGQRVAALWIEPGALVLSDGTRAWRAALDEALLREWQETVARW